MFKIDLWYGNNQEEINEVTVTHYPNGEYRGNTLIDGRYVGDYVCNDSIELENNFPQLAFNWD